MGLSKAFSGKWLMTLYLCKKESCKRNHKYDKLYPEKRELGEKTLFSSPGMLQGNISGLLTEWTTNKKVYKVK